MDFSRILASQSSAGLRKTNLSIECEGCETAKVAEPVALETPCLAAIDCDFDKLLLQEGSPSLVTKPTLEVPTTDDALKEPDPILLEVRLAARILRLVAASLYVGSECISSDAT